MADDEGVAPGDDVQGHGVPGAGPRGPGGIHERPDRVAPRVREDDDTEGHLMVRTDESITSSLTGPDEDSRRR